MGSLIRATFPDAETGSGESCRYRCNQAVRVIVQPADLDAIYMGDAERCMPTTLVWHTSPCNASAAYTRWRQWFVRTNSTPAAARPAKACPRRMTKARDRMRQPQPTAATAGVAAALW